MPPKKVFGKEDKDLLMEDDLDGDENDEDGELEENSDEWEVDDEDDEEV